MLKTFVATLFLLAAYVHVVHPAAMTASDRNLVTQLHNDLRSTLAKGTAQNISGLMPTGSLSQFSYNSTVESTAQSWANQCTMSHSGSGFGENLYMSSSSSLTNAQALQQAVQLWWAELKQFGIQKSLVLSMSEFNKGIGHWSQMAWSRTKQIGCAVASCPSSTWKTYVVCNYSPAGNFLNQVVYTAGNACASCSSSCNSTSGLCL